MQGRSYQPSMSPSSSLPSAASPAVPPSSSNSTRNSKLDHIIQNFYTKTAQLIIQARLTLDGKQMTRERRRDPKKLNKWFNIATEDIDLLRDELKYWRTLAIQSLEEEPPPMIIDIYLDTSKLTQNQSLMVIDDNLRRNRVDLCENNDDYRIQRILIETWVLTLNHPLPDFPVDLPNLYKRSIVFFRSLHSLVRLLPAYNLHRRLRKFNDDRDLAIGYQFSPRNIRRHDEISLDTSILEGDARNPTKSYTFTDIMTPLGTFKLQVNYRRNCDFKIEDSERDISDRFVDMDEQFFTPTIEKYQQGYHTPSRPRPLSMHDSRSSILSEMAQLKEAPTISPTTSTSTSSRYSQPTAEYSDPREIVQQRQRHSSIVPRQSPLSSSPLNRDSKGSTGTSIEPSISTSSTPVSRRTSVPAFSPFKSPSLSSSPQADNMLTGFKTSSSSEKAKSSGVESSSGSFGRKIEFSSSFDKYRSSPSRLDSGGTSMTRRWSRNSDHSSINLFSEMEDTDLEEFVRFVGVKQELKLFQGRTSGTPTISASQLMESGQPSSPTSESSSSMGASGYGTGSIYRSKKALSHFQNLRETHNSLSESVTSSMMAMGIGGDGDDVTGTQQQQQQQQSEPIGMTSGVSPSSSSSSTGRSYQPVIPSPLHAEQHSISPVRIPRSLPPQLSHTGLSSSPSPSPPPPHGSISPTTRPRRHRSSNHQQQTVRHENRHDHQGVTFSSYPQDRHHTDLRRFNLDMEMDPYHERHHTDTRKPRRNDNTTTAIRAYTGDGANVDDDNNKYRLGETSFSKESRSFGSQQPMTTSESSGISGGGGGAERSIMSTSSSTVPTTTTTTTTAAATTTTTITTTATAAATAASSSTVAVSGGVRTSILDDDDSLVFKMSELGGDPSTESDTPPVTSPILFNRPAITGSSQQMFTTKRLLETSSSYDATTHAIRRTNSSDTIGLQPSTYHQKYHPPTFSLLDNNTDNILESKGNTSPSASSCKSEPTTTTTTTDTNNKHLPYFGGW
ncbi:autophagy-related protein 13-domain-containing protein [Halteromyces radiatus]|uniref:autophagy-related protein 13-domain-containing protein n=1 Tax=Halteromyces radiatus TaxID=101107 RepID=UPI00222075A0|nr:autophagy-related protein 13-domain-containing protein [Halteromyces radiatus]KAI8093847.1 autophagy-related protein 13-domain-containing protein [Halteromyces radiatus]